MKLKEVPMYDGRRKGKGTTMDNDEGERVFRSRVTNVRRREGRGRRMMGVHMILANIQNKEEK